MKEKILITGGAGYIGSILTPLLLREGFSVTVLDSLIFRQASLMDCCFMDKFDFIKGDISDHKLMELIVKRFDVILPLAALVGAPACSVSPAMTRLVNYDSQIHLLDLVSQNQMMLFPTTNSGYGVGSRDGLCDETSPLNPISDYAKLKVDIEKEYLRQGNAITFRLATVFGMSPRMRMDLLVNDFVYRAVKDRFIVLFEENFRRNFIHVLDVANAFLFGIKNFELMKGEAFNVGLSAANLTKRQLCEKIKDHVEEFEIVASEVSTDPDKRDYLVSNEKIESLGWQANFTLDHGIAELIRGYRILYPNIYSNA